MQQQQVVINIRHIVVLVCVCIRAVKLKLNGEDLFKINRASPCMIEIRNILENYSDYERLMKQEPKINFAKYHFELNNRVQQ